MQSDLQLFQLFDSSEMRPHSTILTNPYSGEGETNTRSVIPAEVAKPGQWEEVSLGPEVAHGAVETALAGGLLY